MCSCPNSPTPIQALGSFDRSLQGKRRATGHVACEEVRGKRVWAARGHGGPREWVLTAALDDAARGPGTRRREIESREGDHI